MWVFFSLLLISSSYLQTFNICCCVKASPTCLSSRKFLSISLHTFYMFIRSGTVQALSFILLKSYPPINISFFSLFQLLTYSASYISYSIGVQYLNITNHLWTKTLWKIFFFSPVKFLIQKHHPYFLRFLFLFPGYRVCL